MQGEPIRILAVDDRDDNLLAIEAALESPEYQLVRASSGEAALRYLLSNDCALILMDVQMPEMDGFEAARLIRLSPRSRETPIIFLTAINKDERFVSRGYAGGAVDYLFKPVDPEILRAKVAVFANLYRSRLEILRQARLLRDQEAAERARALAELELRSIRREQALQRRYRDLVDGISHAVIWAADPQTFAPTFVSPSAREILGHSPEGEEIARFWDGRLHPDEHAQVTERLRSVGRGEGPAIFEHRFRRDEGSFAWLQTSCRLAEKDGGGLELHGLSVDLTAQQEAQEALQLMARASKELSASLDPVEALRRLFDLLVPGIADWVLGELVHDADDTVRWLGLASGGLQGPIDTLCTLRRPLPLPEPGPQPLLHTGDMVRSLAERAQSDDQREALRLLTPTACLVVPLCARGRRLGSLTLGLSRPEARFDERTCVMAEELGGRAAQAIDNALLYTELQASLRLREDFLSVASHELRTPLTPLKLQLDTLARLLEREDIPPQPRETAVRKLSATQRNLERLTRLVESLLDVSRIRTGKLELHLEQVDLGGIVQDALGRVREELVREGIELREHFEGPLTGHWDRFRLDQIVTNLLSNAIKYGMHKPILVTARGTDDLVVLSVQDQGIGITGENPDRVFQRFERAVDSRSYGGLGLGLYIVRQLVELHGGRVTVTTREGQGSLFTVELPRGQTTDGPSPTEAPSRLVPKVARDESLCRRQLG